MSLLMYNMFPEAATHRIGKRVYRLPAFVLRLAVTLAAEAEESYAAYLADCESDRQAGYRAHYCEHGTNLWTDYDNICGPCEDGRTNSDPMQRRERALAEAKRIYGQAEALIRGAEVMSQNGIAYDSTALLATAAKILSLPNPDDGVPF